MIKKTIIILLMLATAASAKLKVVTTYPYIADIVKIIGKDRVSATALAPGAWDPHFVVPKPSLIARVRQADLLILNGAELEIGWLPPVVREARNPKVKPGSGGFLDLSAYIELIDVPENVSRAQGDVHPSGNPHFCLDPHNIKIIAEAVRERLSALDLNNSDFFQKNLDNFLKLWDNKLKEWENALKPLVGAKVVQYHKNYDYFCNRYGIIPIIELEPLPGIAPTSKHILRVINVVKNKNAKIILNDVYHSTKPAELVADKTGIKVIVLPHDVNAVKEAKNIVSLFDEIVRRLTE